MSAAVVSTIGAMARWEPNAQGRLEQAAMELYAERGFDDTTVAEIATRAGLTERTFFRHYADKREVLFGGGEMLAELLRMTLADAAAPAGPLAAVASALEAVGARIQEFRGRDYSRRRQGVIAANPQLQERELSKLASWADVLAEGLRARGVDEPFASLAGQAGVAAFRVGWARWLDGGDDDLPSAIRASFDELKALSAADVAVAG